MRDAGHRTPDGEKSKNNISTPQGGGHNNTNWKKKLNCHKKNNCECCYSYFYKHLNDLTVITLKIHLQFTSSDLNNSHIRLCL